MSFVSLEDFTPPPRHDVPTPLPWRYARMEAATILDPATWMVRETIDLSLTDEGLDVDPEAPIARDFSTENAAPLDYWWRVVFIMEDGDESPPSDPIRLVPWRPSVQDVADECSEHTRVPIELGGQMRRVFDETTNPPASAVQGFISSAVRDVEAKVGVDILASRYELARTAAAWLAAAMVEATVPKGDIDAPDSAFAFKQRQYLGSLSELQLQARRQPLRMA